MASSEEIEEAVDYLNEKAEEFDTLCADRHAAGAQEYGQLTFLGNDVVRMMLEELADITNYCRMQAVKLLVLQESLEQQLGEIPQARLSGEDLQIGFESFRGTKDVGWQK